MLELNKIYLMDCMEGMAQIPDKYFELAIVDPPYFEGPNKRRFYGNTVSPIGVRRVDYPVTTEWEIPKESYFAELFRVSKNQIIWGCNYFGYTFRPGRVVWDKCNGESSFSDCEIAFCSLHDSVRLFRYLWNGMMQGKSITEGHLQRGDKRLNERRIHPTQKPVVLYKWLLSKYAESGDKILDTHVGSASSLIACHELGFEFCGFEIDPGYHAAASKRLSGVMAQTGLFDEVEVLSNVTH